MDGKTAKAIGEKQVFGTGPLRSPPCICPRLELTDRSAILPPLKAKARPLPRDNPRDAIFAAKC